VVPPQEIEAHFAAKERALAGLKAPDIKLPWFRAHASLMQFSQTLKLCIELVGSALPAPEGSAQYLTP